MHPDLKPVRVGPRLCRLAEIERILVTAAVAPGLVVTEASPLVSSR